MLRFRKISRFYEKVHREVATEGDANAADAGDFATDGKLPAADVPDALRMGTFVRLSCRIRGVYLVIKVLNSCAPRALDLGESRHGDNDSMREHGWGMQMVEQIAQRHDGRFTLNRITPVKTAATVILKIHHV